jgi:hypothetical protein
LAAAAWAGCGLTAAAGGVCGGDEETPEIVMGSYLLCKLGRRMRY